MLTKTCFFGSEKKNFSFLISLLFFLCFRASCFNFSFSSFGFLHNSTSRSIFRWWSVTWHSFIAEDANTRQYAKRRKSSTAITNNKKARFEEEEKTLHKKYKARRARDYVVDSHYLQSQMRIMVKNSGENTDWKFKASNMWLSNFTKRWGISKQKKTNKKSKSLEERLPKIRDFHWYTIYQMATEDP